MKRSFSSSLGGEVNFPALPTGDMQLEENHNYRSPKSALRPAAASFCHQGKHSKLSEISAGNFPSVKLDGLLLLVEVSTPDPRPSAAGFNESIFSPSLLFTPQVSSSLQTPVTGAAKPARQHNPSTPLEGHD